MITTQIDSQINQLIGQFRTFGPSGPVYEILGHSRKSNGKKSIHVKVLTSGEEIDYPMEQALKDPEAH